MKQLYNYITKDQYTHLTSLIRKAIKAIKNTFIVRWLKKYTIYINKQCNERESFTTLQLN